MLHIVFGICTSGDEWEGTTYFKVGNHLVKNVKDAKESIAVGAKMPMQIVKETKRFTAKSLNNRLIFIATNAHSKSEHNPAKGDSVCGLILFAPEDGKKVIPLQMSSSLIQTGIQATNHSNGSVLITMK